VTLINGREFRIYKVADTNGTRLRQTWIDGKIVTDEEFTKQLRNELKHVLCSLHAILY
jgi:hypothetical protein